MDGWLQRDKEENRHLAQEEGAIRKLEETVMLQHDKGYPQQHSKLQARVTTEKLLFLDCVVVPLLSRGPTL